MKPSILVVEDEIPIQKGLCDLLVYNAMQPIATANGAEALQLIKTQQFQLILLDVMLPEIDGFTLCKKARELQPTAGIIMLTAKGQETDILEGFACGCDDYISKPFSISQLMARISALLRRTRTNLPTSPEGLVIDQDNLEITWAGHTTQISKRDMEVICHLFTEKHRIVSREELLQQVWGYRAVNSVETRCVDMHIVKLRRKLRPLFGEQEIITTIRGAGYRFRIPDESSQG